MINNTAWQTILQTAIDFTTVVEFYDPDTVPDVTNGFDPQDAIVCYAASNNISFPGNLTDYTRAIESIGNIKRTTSGEVNKATVTFSNVNHVISRFESTTGFEGLIMVVRLFSRASSDTLAKSQILFAGRCEKPGEGTKESLTVTASWVLGNQSLGGQNVIIPRRKYTREDQEGRVDSDPEFEGFQFMPQQGVSSYQVQVKRGGILGFLFGGHKWITQTLAWSSYSDLDANKNVPEVFGQSQLVGTHIAYADTGGYVLLRTAFCEGEIQGYSNIRSLNPNLPLDLTAGQLVQIYGKTGAANLDSGGQSPGNYSRTACVRGRCSNSALDVNDSAPDIAAIIIGRKLLTPNGSGVWNTTAWTCNAVDIARYIITSADYFKLDPAWVADADAYVTWLYNDENILSRNNSDLVWLKEN